MDLGIDTHTRYAQVAVGVDDSNFQDKFRLPNDRLDELAEEYAGSNAVIEASGNYRPIYEILDEHLSVTLANLSKNRFISLSTPGSFTSRFFDAIVRF